MKSLKWYITLTLLTVGLFATVFFTVRAVTKKTLIAHAQANLTPFTAERWVYSYTKSSDGSLVQKEITAVNAAGSRAIIGTLSVTDSLDSSAYSLRTIERVDRFYARLVDELGLVSSFYLPNTDKLVARAVLAQQGCIDPTKDRQVLGRQRVGDFDTIVLQTNRPATLRLTQWFAPELGCFVLQQTAEKLQSDGSYRLMSEYKLQSVRTGEPDPALFVVPSNYVEMRPSEQERRLIDHLGVTPPDMTGQWAHEDQSYDQMRANQSVPK